ncbi:MAG: hypothetical protein ACKVOW_07885 [Chitinophagaceae bacterium]
MQKKYLIFVASVFLLNSCKEEMVDFSSNNCKQNPFFIQSMGFVPANSFFSTSEERIMGLVLHQSDEVGNPNARIVKSFQHPSWRLGGWLAPILIDNTGDLYTAPAPFISLLDNPVANQNTIYRVDSKTGTMDVFMKLPLVDTNSIQNAFGIIGMALLCETNTLFVSTLAGSDRKHERGAIYAIDIPSKKIIDKLSGIDAMGMGISYVTGKRELFFGTGRTSEVFSVVLNKKGEFSGSAQMVISLSGLGANGDDKVRRIRTDALGNLEIHGISFNYNLIPQREKKETVYHFYYELESKKWMLK